MRRGRREPGRSCDIAAWARSRLFGTDIGGPTPTGLSPPGSRAPLLGRSRAGQARIGAERGGRRRRAAAGGGGGAGRGARRAAGGAAYLVAAGEQLAPRWRAQRLRVVVVQQHSAGRQRVQVRRADFRAVEAHVVPAQVVRQHEDEVRRPAGPNAGTERRQQQQQQPQREDGGEERPPLPGASGPTLSASPAHLASPALPAPVAPPASGTTYRIRN